MAFDIWAVGTRTDERSGVACIDVSDLVPIFANGDAGTAALDFTITCAAVELDSSFARILVGTLDRHVGGSAGIHGRAVARDSTITLDSTCVACSTVERRIFAAVGLKTPLERNAMTEL